MFRTLFRPQVYVVIQSHMPGLVAQDQAQVISVHSSIYYAQANCGTGQTVQGPIPYYHAPSIPTSGCRPGYINLEPTIGSRWRPSG